MRNKIQTKRLLYVIPGVLIMFFSGFHNSWSIFAASIAKEFNWSQADLSLTFTIHMIFFCAAGILSGYLSKKIRIRYSFWIGAAAVLAAFVLSYFCQSRLVLYLGYGVLGGLGTGITYNSAMTVLSKWFADRPGLISGILLMSFGIGGFVLGKLFNAVTPDAAGGWRQTFLFFGIIAFVLILVSGFFLRLPREEEKIDAAAIRKTSARRVQEEGVEQGPSFMLKRPAFWFFFFWATLLSLSGMVIISQAGKIVIDQVPTLSGGTVTTIVGLVSIFNGVGRIIWGLLYDLLGRKKNMLFVSSLYFISSVVLILSLFTHSLGLLAVGFILAGLSFGGVLPTASAFTNAFYGSENYASNYSIMNLNLFIASFGGLISGALYDMSGSYLTSAFMMLIAVVLSGVCMLFVKRP